MQFSEIVWQIYVFFKKQDFIKISNYNNTIIVLLLRKLKSILFAHITYNRLISIIVNPGQ